MLYAKDCAHVKAKDWALIAEDIMKIKSDEQLLVAVSDGHDGGATTAMHEVREVIGGFASHANILLLNGDDFEFESPACFLDRMQEFRTHYANLSERDFLAALQVEAEKALHEKVLRDLATVEKIIVENPDRQVVKIIGNHENFDTFRNGLRALADKYPNFTYSEELAVIPMPGGKKATRDRLLAAHGDLQMDDLWFVEPGGTDRERPVRTHAQMAKKVVGIATKYWAPSAQKQEKGQGFVNWWRSAKRTGKTLFAELLFRAQEGDLHENMNMEAVELAMERLKERRKKFEEMKEEAEKDKSLTPDEQHNAIVVCDRAIVNLRRKRKELEQRAEEIENKAKAAPDLKPNKDKILHYYKIGKDEKQVLDSKALAKITHINYGHTHVSEEGVDIAGMGKDEITVSNNASVTGAIMCKSLDDKGKPCKQPKGAKPEVELGNLGILLYRVKDGKITEIKTLGSLLAENINVVKQMVRRVPQAVTIAPDLTKQDAISPLAVLSRRGQHSGTGSPN